MTQLSVARNIDDRNMMRITPGSRRARLADLYYLSGSFRTDGPFEFAAHKTNPELEKSPQKLRLPEAGDPGLIYLSEMCDLVSMIFLEMIEAEDISPDCFAGVPAGVEPIAACFAKRVQGNIRHLRFLKEERYEDNYFVGPVEGSISPGDLILAFDDHTSGGHNKKRFMAAVRRAGGEVNWFFTIVDRGQGAVAFMERLGVIYRWIFTLEELLEYYLEKAYISPEVASDVRSYVARNQIGETA